MIRAITGNIVEKKEQSLLISVQSFVFEVLCSNSVLSLATVESEITLHTHFHVREDALSLFGFASSSDLQLFEKLISVSGIGPKIGLEIMSYDANIITTAILNEDIAMLTSMKGIGKKTAERVILELREKIEMPSGGSATTSGKVSHGGEEVIETLENLGWKRKEIQKTLQSVPEGLGSTEEIVKWFLTQAR